MADTGITRPVVVSAAVRTDEKVLPSRLVPVAVSLPRDVPLTVRCALPAASPVTVRSPLLLTVAVTLPSRLRVAVPVTVVRTRIEFVVTLSIADCAVPAAFLIV